MIKQHLLENVRVIDLSQYIPGPLATRQLADLGAEVIKIEPPGGDPMRNFMHNESQAPSPVYRHLNRGKRVCELNLKSESGKQALGELIVDADILLESFRPGVLTRLGFDREQLDRLNPRLIHCALSGYGQNGPYAQRAGHDINYCALSSQSIVSGSAQKPVIAYPPIADHAAALQASTLMLAALHARDKRETGIYLDLSITESILAWQYLPLLADASNRASSLLNGGAACYNIYQCADQGFISLGAIEPGFWKNFCAVVNKPNWVARQYEPMPQTVLIEEVAGLMTSRNVNHWRDLLDDIDCCFEALFSADGIVQQAQLKSRHAVTTAGPTYPAWIDQQAVETATDFEQFATNESLRWNPRTG
ncbi:MAG: CoA transferase [Gammaproteobacteria bacterium]|nr:CoA transferase [Gammaproteobacteria bacterium]